MVPTRNSKKHGSSRCFLWKCMNSGHEMDWNGGSSHFPQPKKNGEFSFRPPCTTTPILTFRAHRYSRLQGQSTWNYINLQHFDVLRSAIFQYMKDDTSSNYTIYKIRIKCCTLWLWLTVCHGKSPCFMGKPSISMGHLYHGYVSHNQRVQLT